MRVLPTREGRSITGPGGFASSRGISFGNNRCWKMAPDERPARPASRLSPARRRRMVVAMIPRQPAVAVPWLFNGLRLKPELCATGRRAAHWRAEGGEWVRPVAAPGDWRRAWPEGVPPARTWAVDFPPGADERFLSEAGAAGRSFRRAGARIARRGAAAELRIALAKCDRYLATPAGNGRARWRWVPAAALPGGALIVVARDDEFLAGVLASRWLEVWRRGAGRRLDAGTVRSFPLPWAPETLRGSLTREREERRDVVVRAWRAAGGGLADFAPESCAAEELDAAVAAAYGWPAGLGAEEALRRLRAPAPVAEG